MNSVIYPSPTREMCCVIFLIEWNLVEKVRHDQEDGPQEQGGMCVCVQVSCGDVQVSCGDVQVSCGDVQGSLGEDPTRAEAVGSSGMEREQTRLLDLILPLLLRPAHGDGQQGW